MANRVDIEKMSTSGFSLFKMIAGTGVGDIDGARQGLVEKVIGQMYEGARLGHLESFFYLGQVHKRLGDVRNAYGFSLLALEEHWLRGLPPMAGDMAVLRAPDFWGELIEGLKKEGHWKKGALDVLSLYPTEQEKKTHKVKKKQQGASAGEMEPLNTKGKDALLIFKKNRTLFKDAPYLTKEDFENRRIKMDLAGKYYRNYPDPFIVRAKKLYEEGKYEESVVFLKESGSPNAYCNLGGLFYDGHVGCLEDGTPNYEEAARWYKKAAEGGDVNACCNLGALFYNGHVGCLEDGTPNYEEAARWYKKAAEGGDVKAWSNLGSLLAKGHVGRLEDGTPNYQFALRCFKEGNPSDVSVCMELYELYIKRTPQELGLRAEEINEERKKVKEAFRANIGKDIRRRPLECYVKQGRMAVFDGEYEEALINYQEALLRGDRLSRYMKKILENEIQTFQALLSQQQELEALKQEEDRVGEGEGNTQPTSGENTVPALQTQLLQEVLKDTVEDKTNISDWTVEAATFSLDEGESGSDGESSPVALEEAAVAKAEVQSKSHAQSRKQKRIARLKKEMEESRQKALKLMGSGWVQSKKEENTSVAEPVRSLVLKYQTKKVQVACEGDFKDQVNQLLEDIRLGEWKTDGRGKPEILKSVRFTDANGKRIPIYSRRLSKGDRFICAVPTAGEILVIGCGGHYNELQ